MTEKKLIILIPARNEENSIAACVNAISNQTYPIRACLIINDGSTDKTDEIAKELALKHNWVHYVYFEDRGFRNVGKGVAQTVNKGYNYIKEIIGEDWDLLAKVDGDTIVSESYFEELIEKIEKNPEIVLVSGQVYYTKDAANFNDWDNIIVEKTLFSHPRGTGRIYKFDFWNQMNGLKEIHGWDSYADFFAKFTNQKAILYPEIKMIQTRQTSSSNGLIKGRKKQGKTMFILGYNPFIAIGRSLKMMLRWPLLISGIAMLWGYFGGYFNRKERILSKWFYKNIRIDQRNRLLTKIGFKPKKLIPYKKKEN